MNNPNQISCIDLSFILLGLMLFCLTSLFYINRMITAGRYERYINLIMHLLIVPFTFLFFYQLYSKAAVTRTLDVLIVILFLVSDFIVKNTTNTNKQFNTKNKGNYIRFGYFTLYFLMLFAILYRSFSLSGELGFFVLILLHITIIIFLLYLRKYEKSLSIH